MNFAVGDKVRLQACRFGEPGTVLRIERRKLVVYWADLDYLGRYPEASLVLADVMMIEQQSRSSVDSVPEPKTSISNSCVLMESGVLRGIDDEGNTL